MLVLGGTAAISDAVFDTPILLTNAGAVPASTADFLAPGIGGDMSGSPLVTCVMSRPACEGGRVAAGLPAAVVVTLSPASGPFQPVQEVGVALEGYDGPATVSGTCLAAPVTIAGGSGSVTARGDRPEPCTVVVGDVVLANGSTQRRTVTFHGGDVVAALDPPDAAGLCALAVAGAVELLYSQECFVAGMVLRTTAGAGAVPDRIASPFGSSNDLDLDVIDEAAVVGDMQVPAGSLLVVHGETSPRMAVIHPADGAVLAGPLVPQATGSTVGAAWDGTRSHVIELRWDTDVISRLDPATGASLTTFPVSPGGAPPSTCSTATWTWGAMATCSSCRAPPTSSVS